MMITEKALVIGLRVTVNWILTTEPSSSSPVNVVSMWKPWTEPIAKTVSGNGVP
jgi:hypothetical protein